ncbi:MAG TPA: acetyl-CoA carboxylase, carboxyltransferase subunit beta, partial [Candidatus Methanoperedens sp.]|nr:acetyl-CoA carboxylase, carboxyltransferase subunit beta [Candidatus Methanoperedens sp.]
RAEGTRPPRVPEGLWIICPGCREIIYRKEVERNLRVCTKCSHHFRIGARERIRLLVDEGSFTPYDEGVGPEDPLHFKDSRRYADRVKDAGRKSGCSEAILCGEGRIQGRPLQLGAFEFDFMGGSMGSVVGERIARAAERACSRRTPLAIVSCSGGARMQEGLLSLMQMAKTAASLARLGRERLPYLSILADPTTGGVSASFAMLGDVILAEPNALVGFAGPRVIEQTIGGKLPEGFQRAEFLAAHGFVDVVVERAKLRETVARLLAFFAG